MTLLFSARDTDADAKMSEETYQKRKEGNEI
jgi:hypothetical protein